MADTVMSSPANTGALIDVAWSHVLSFLPVDDYARMRCASPAMHRVSAWRTSHGATQHLTIRVDKLVRSSSTTAEDVQAHIAGVLRSIPWAITSILLRGNESLFTSSGPAAAEAAIAAKSSAASKLSATKLKIEAKRIAKKQRLLPFTVLLNIATRVMELRDAAEYPDENEPDASAECDADVQAFKFGDSKDEDDDESAADLAFLAEKFALLDSLSMSHADLFAGSIVPVFEAFAPLVTSLSFTHMCMQNELPGWDDEELQQYSETVYATIAKYAQYEGDADLKLKNLIMSVTLGLDQPDDPEDERATACLTACIAYYGAALIDLKLIIPMTRRNVSLLNYLYFPSLRSLHLDFWRHGMTIYLGGSQWSELSTLRLHTLDSNPITADAVSGSVQLIGASADVSPALLATPEYVFPRIINQWLKESAKHIVALGPDYTTQQIGGHLKANLTHLTFHSSWTMESDHLESLNHYSALQSLSLLSHITKIDHLHRLSPESLPALVRLETTQARQWPNGPPHASLDDFQSVHRFMTLVFSQMLLSTKDGEGEEEEVLDGKRRCDLNWIEPSYELKDRIQLWYEGDLRSRPTVYERLEDDAEGKPVFRSIKEFFLAQARANML